MPPLLLRGGGHKPARAGNGSRAPTGRVDHQPAQASTPRLNRRSLATMHHASYVVSVWAWAAPVDKAPNVMRRKAEAKAARTIERRPKASEREQWASDDGKAALALTK